MSFRSIGLAAALLVSFAYPAFAQFSSMGAPGTWQPFGGGSFRSNNPVPQGNHFFFNPFNNNLSLVIGQTQEGHEQVGDLLQQLRRLQDQQVSVQNRFITLNDNFYERIGFDFDFNIKGGRGVRGLDAAGNPTRNGAIQFRQGSFDSAIPQFGGHDPNADLRTGFRVGNGDTNASLRMAFGQGSTRTNTVQAPRVTMFNGTTGSVSDTSQRPFVTGIVPVVGAGVPVIPQMMVPVQTVSPVQQSLHRLKQQQQIASAQRRAHSRNPQPANAGVEPALRVSSRKGSSSAEAGDLSVAEIRRRRAAGRERTEAASHSSVTQARSNLAEANASSSAEETWARLKDLVRRGQAKEADGNTSLARIYYEQASRLAKGESKRKILERLDSLE